MERQGFGLTQTCRLVRQEFLPLYRPELWVSLWYTKALEYTLLVFPNLAEAVGTVVLRYPLDVHQRWPFDIMPLVHLATQAPALQFFFEFSCLRPYLDVHGCEQECEDLLDDFFDLQESRDGLARAAEIFKEIMLQRHGELFVPVELYAAHTKLWMPDRHVAHWSRSLELDGMLRSVGLRAWAGYAYKIDMSAEQDEDEDEDF